MSKRKITPIFSQPDRETARPILDALAEKGFRVEEDAARTRGAAVLLFLSESFAADAAAQERFFTADSAGCEIIPVDLDGAPQSELVRSALIAKNTIAASGRTAEEIAARAASAPCFEQKKSPLTRLLIAAALLLALVAALWLWSSRADGNALPALTEGELAAARRLGLTAEDLATIETFTVVGDVQGQSRASFTTDSTVNPGLRVYLGDLAYDSEEGDGRHWYSAEDGREFTLTRYEDLSVIELMPNLRSLTLVLVETDRLPALKGLDKLEELRLENCRLGDLDWVEGAKFLYFTCRGCDVEDFSVLGSCERLRDAELELEAVPRASLSGSGAPSLSRVSIRGGGALEEIELSGLRGCPLRELHLDDLPLRDLEFLSGRDELRELELTRLHLLRDIGPVRGLSGLRTVWITDLPNVDDLSALGACEDLGEFCMDRMSRIRDLDFLENCRRLQSVSLRDVELEDLDFLGAMSRSDGVRLGVSGRVGDWSGLALIGYYEELQLGPGDGSVAGILPYLAASSAEYLEIDGARDLDLSALPPVLLRLSLRDCSGLTDLSALGEGHSFSSLELSGLPRLRSLDGLEKVRPSAADPGRSCLQVENCPRLDDWSALKGMSFSEIRLINVYTLPDFGSLSYSGRTVIRLERIPGLTDLSCFDGVKAPEGLNFCFELIELDDLRDLGALRRFRGDYIGVTPALKDRAQALVDAGCFGRLDLAYPAGGWNEGYDSFELYSLEELDTLSDAALARVTSVAIAGDLLVDRSRCEVRDEWDGERHHTVVVDRETGERTEVGMGGVTDLSALSKLSGLRQLALYNQPLESLDGVQLFSELEELRIQNCPALMDVSAAFTLQRLRCLEAGRCPIVSIRGVQNLCELCELYIYETKVRDLSPLRELDPAAAAERGGFRLSLGATDCEDYSPVESLGAIASLDLNGVSCERWPDLTRLSELRSLMAHGCGLTQEKLEELLRAHPELEELQIPYNPALEDLRPLLELKELRCVLISAQDMERAAESLRGQSCGFELEIR